MTDPGTAKRMIINTRERAVSSDINQLQQFAAQERNDVLAAMLTPSIDSIFAPGQSTPVFGVSLPMVGYVLDGLMAQVDSPGSVQITMGTLVAFPASPIDQNNSGWYTVVDMGVNDTSTLPIAQNTSGSVRVDVIECSIGDTLVLHQSRDVYNPSTGLFTPGLVEKVRKPALTYRVRPGTPGAAPGYAAGWLPLAVAVIQPGTLTANLAHVDFYDCRPLWRELDHAHDYRAVVTSEADTSSGDWFLPTVPLEANWQIQGLQATVPAVGYAATKAFGVTLGGHILKNVPCTSAEFAGSNVLNLDAQDCWKSSPKLPGGTGVQDDIVGLFAVLPDLGGGQMLPRFVRYSQTASPRVPSGPNGLLLWANFKDFSDPIAQLQDKRKGGEITSPRIAGCLGVGVGVMLACTHIAGSSVNVAWRASVHALTQFNLHAVPPALETLGFRTPDSGYGLTTDDTHERWSCALCPADGGGTNVITNVWRRLRALAALTVGASACLWIQLDAYVLLGAYRQHLASKLVPVSASNGAQFAWEFDIDLAWVQVGGNPAQTLYIDVSIPVMGSGSTVPTLATSGLRFIGAATN